jgi:carbon-monoxide dehydrogenase small subunit
MLAEQARDLSITTVEGIAPEGELHPVQKAFAELGAPQCGFCTPGMVLVAVDLLRRNPAPTREEIREAISGNICRCSGYVKILDAVEKAAETIRQGGADEAR